MEVMPLIVVTTPQREKRGKKKAPMVALPLWSNSKVTRGQHWVLMPKIKGLNNIEELQIVREYMLSMFTSDDLLKINKLKYDIDYIQDEVV